MTSSGSYSVKLWVLPGTEISQSLLARAPVLNHSWCEDIFFSYVQPISPLLYHVAVAPWPFTVHLWEEVLASLPLEVVGDYVIFFFLPPLRSLISGLYKMSPSGVLQSLGNLSAPLLVSLVYQCLSCTIVPKIGHSLPVWSRGEQALSYVCWLCICLGNTVCG